MKACDAAQKYGILKTTWNQYMKDILRTLQVTSSKKAQNLFILELLYQEKILYIINGLDFKLKSFTPRLLTDEEVHVVASDKMKCLASQQ